MNIVIVDEGEAIELRMLKAIVGAQKYDELVDSLGGSSVYIPKRPGLDRRDSTIRGGYDRLVADGVSRGEAVRALSERYSLSPRRIRQILFEPVAAS